MNKNISSDEIIITLKEFAFQNDERDKRAGELVIANKELLFQNKEKAKRARELIIANKELLFENKEKAKRAEELIVANKELSYQNEEKAKRAEELSHAYKELAAQNAEKVQLAAELLVANQILAAQNNERLKDITDYKHALDESSIVSITNHKGIITHVNENFLNISKYSAEELIGKDHRILNSGHHPKEYIRNLWQTISKGIVWRGELKNIAKDGSIYWVDTTIVTFVDEQNKPYQYVSIRTDITKRKLAEKEIQILNDDLELRVIERTDDLESFSYSVSHDLRAPLRAVNGYARMLKKGYEKLFDTEAERLINKIMDNSRKMGQLIDDLLTFSRVGRRELARMNIPMTAIVTDICNELNKEAESGQVKFDIKSLLPASADQIGIKQVWQNLISNAIKYCGLKEQAVIEIGSYQKDTETVYYIRDNGAGFDMRYYNKLFNIFQRLHLEEEFEGTGVGLAIVKRIISKHGGRIWAEGKVNEGATFYFTLNKV